MKPSPPLVVAGWGAFLSALALILAGFGGKTSSFRLIDFWTAVGFVEIFALAVLISRRRRPGPASSRRKLRSAAPAAAIGIACLMGAIGWTWGIWMAYFALPLCGFVAVRLYNEARSRANKH